MDRTVGRPFDHVKKEMAGCHITVLYYLPILLQAQGHAPPSFVHHILADPDRQRDVNSAEFQQLLTWTAGTMYGGEWESITADALSNSNLLAGTETVS
jgi:hypothetical protein